MDRRRNGEKEKEKEKIEKRKEKMESRIIIRLFECLTSDAGINALVE